MKRTHTILLLGALLGGTMPILRAQPWLEGLPEGERNFHSVRSAFYSWWDGRDSTQKGKGWKQFKRWEWFWEQRVWPSGEFPDPMQLWNESRRVRPPGAAAGAQNAGNWSEMGPGESPGGYAGLGRLNCVRVNPLNPDILWVGSASGGLWKSPDGGWTWSTQTDELPSIGVTDLVIQPSDTSIMYLATGDGDAGDTYSVGILKSTDAGETWNTTGLAWSTSQTRRISRLLMHPSDPLTLIAAGSGIHKTTDGGATWAQVQSGTFRDMEFRPDDPSVLYASGASGSIHRSTNGGNSWLPVTAGLPGGGGRVALGVTPAAPAYVYALFASSSSSGFQGFYRSTDGGATWSLRSSSPNILGWSETGSDGGGQGWYDLCMAVSEFNPGEVYTGGINAWKSTDGGLTWRLASFWYGIGGVSTVHADQHDFHFVPGSDILYAGNDGGIYRTVDGAATWQWLGSGLRPTQFYRLGLSATDPGLLIAGSQDNGTKALAAGSWNDVLGGDGMEAMVDHTNPLVMYGSLYYGDIYRSVNGGSSFSLISGGIPETGAWVTPYIMHPSNHLLLYAGYTSVWKSADGGSTWQSIGSPGGGTLTILASAPSDPRVIYAGRGSSLARTTDGGATSWQPVPVPTSSASLTYLAVHPQDPLHLWVTCSGYSAPNKVFESTDGGWSWTNISGSLPNVPVNCIVYQNNSPERVYVGTDIGVWYRDLTHPDWQDFNNGLANVVVSELEIQDAARKLRAATYGRGIWESDLLPNQGVVIGASPGTLDFGPLEAAAGSDTARITVASYGTDTLEVTSVGGTTPAFRLVDVPPLPARLGPGSSLSFSVVFAPSSHGACTDSLTIGSNAPQVLRVFLKGRGVEIGRAAPGLIYAASSQGGGSLYTLNPATAAPTLVGPLRIPELHGLGIHPSSGELYGAATGSSKTFFYRVSSSYGETLPCAAVPLGNMRAFAFAGAGSLFGGTSTGRLYRLDLSSADTVYVGTAPGLVYAAFSFQPGTGELWASVRPPVANRDRIYRVNTSTGAALLVGSVGDGVITPSIAFGPTGILYGLKGFSSITNTIITIDTSGGTGTLLGSTGMSGLLAITMRTDSLVTGAGEPAPEGVPSGFALGPAWPNPFNPSTRMRVELPGAADLELRVFDLLGRPVALLASGTFPAGYHDAVWDGRSDSGQRVSSGIYIARLEARPEGHGTPFRALRKLLLMK
ncbi:MAG: FlgD immunoglobulin-like domain containing protein [Bacteroidota bacterium]